MSAIGGIYNFDGAPVNDGFLIALGQALAARGPDGGSEYMSGPLGMVYRAFHTNRESRIEGQPLVSSRSQVLCWDGRLDNREELIPILRGELCEDQTDVAIVLAAYLRWGVDFPSRIIGDFALSLWDPHSRTLMLARDPVGIRLLYYHTNEHRIIWSTELEALLDLAGVELKINENYIADFLTRYPEPGQTPYKTIHGVPPAHVMTTKNGKIQVQRYWGINPNRVIRYKTDAEYEEHFRHLFREAVHCRLRSDSPVWAELSGGLDSSSIVCMADDIVKSSEAEAPCLETASRVFDEASRSDERKYIHPVEEKIGRKGLHLREDDHRMFSYLDEEYSRVIPNPISGIAEYYKALSIAMRNRHARVLLAGHGGDEILCSGRDPAPELAELLVRCRLLKLHHSALTWSTASKRPYFRILWKKAVVPSLPQKLQHIRPARYVVDISEIYCREFVKHMNLRERLASVRDVFGFRYPTGREQSRRFLILVRSLAAGFYQELITADTTYPFTHRPLIEFMQAIPFDQKVRPSEAQSVARRALRDLLPSEVANRNGKGLNVYAILRGLAREWQRLDGLFTDARVCAYGYVNSQGLKDLLGLAKRGEDSKATYLLSLVPLEYWLRALESRKSVTRSDYSVPILTQARATAATHGRSLRQNPTSTP